MNIYSFFGYTLKVVRESGSAEEDEMRFRFRTATVPSYLSSRPFELGYHSLAYW
jgi:hypothetical protein